MTQIICLDAARNAIYSRVTRYFYREQENKKYVTGSCHICGHTIRGIEMPGSKIYCDAQYSISSARQPIEKGFPVHVSSPIDIKAPINLRFTIEKCAIFLTSDKDYVFTNIPPLEEFPEKLIALRPEVGAKKQLIYLINNDEVLVEFAVLFSKRGDVQYWMNADEQRVVIFSGSNTIDIDRKIFKKVLSDMKAVGLTKYIEMSLIKNLIASGDKSSTKRFEVFQKRNSEILSKYWHDVYPYTQPEVSYAKEILKA